MDDVEELRYPFESLLDFLGGGYVLGLESLHLTLGLVFVLGLVVSLRPMTPFRAAVLYFALTVFANPVYIVGALRINELFGVLAVVSMLLSGRTPNLRRASPATLGLFAVFFIGAAHAAAVSIAYSGLIAEQGDAITKFAVNMKVLVLAFNMLIVGETLRKGSGATTLIKACVAAGTAGLLLYVVQVCMLLLGTVPYGTYLDAGFVGVPSFGSVAIERGHFGKFMAAYYVFFLFAALAWGWRWRMCLLALITLINFSASGQVFFATFMLLGLWTFRARLKILPVLFAVAFVTALAVEFADAFAGVAAKIYEVGLRGEDQGGRGVDVFHDYLIAFPAGIGYSGSTLRTAPGLPEINAAHFAFLAQYSLVLGPAIFIVYLWLVWSTIRRAKKDLLCKTMAIGVILSVVVFFTDVLWFVPLMWLPFEIARHAPDQVGLYTVSRRKRRRFERVLDASELSPNPVRASPSDLVSRQKGPAKC